MNFKDFNDKHLNILKILNIVKWISWLIEFLFFKSFPILLLCYIIIYCLYFYNLLFEGSKMTDTLQVS